jgi:anti-sigma regulatory factor (Ser/Thr protein kinase)
MPGPPQRIDDHAAVYPTETAVIAHARNEFAAWLSRVTLDDEAVDDLTIVLSELLANAIRASGSVAGTVHVLACFDGREVTLEVRNQVTDWVPADARWDLADPLRGGGRGFVIVDALVDELDVEHDPRSGTTVVRSRTALATA